MVGVRLAHGDLAAAQPKAAVFTLLDGLADSVLVVQAIRDGAGQVTGCERKPGPQVDRQFSAPMGGPTTLKETT